MLHSYQDYQKSRRELASIANALLPIAHQVDVSSEFLENLERVRNTVATDDFRVIVVGSFSRGKSTMINALLGNEILPAKLTPTTAVITVIRHGTEPKASIYMKGSTNSKIVPLENLKDHLVIPRGAYKETDFGNRIETETERVEIEYPLDLCKNGVEIVDSPGLEEDETRQQITLRFLNQSDAAIVLLSCQQLITMEEERFIKEDLIRRGFDHIFYVINFCDELSTDETEEIRYRAEMKLGKDQRVFMLSSRDALRAKAYQNEALLQTSQFVPFEKSLEQFLVTEKGRHKLQTSSRLVNHRLEELTDLVQIKLSLLERKKEEDLRQVEENFTQQRKAIESRKHDLMERIGEMGLHATEKILMSFATKCREVSRQLPQVAKEVQVEGSLWQRSAYQENVAAILSEYIHGEITGWSRDTVSAIAMQELEKMKRHVDKELAGLLEEIDEIKVMLDPKFRSNVKTGEDAFERIAAAAGSLLIGDLGGVLTGGALGLKGAMMQIGTVMAANMALYMIGLLNPVTAIAVSLGTAFFLTSSQSEKMKEEMRVNVANQLRASMEDLPDQNEHRIREAVFDQFNQIAHIIDDGINAMLKDIQNQLTTARKAISQGRDEAIRDCKDLLEKVSLLRGNLAEAAASLDEPIEEPPSKMAPAEAPPTLGPPERTPRESSWKRRRR